jgi:hypothetical protein
MSQEKEILQYNFESKVSMRIESNSRGYTTSVHVYSGAKKVDIDETVAKAIYAHQQLQQKLAPTFWLMQLNGQKAHSRTFGGCI